MLQIYKLIYHFLLYSFDFLVIALHVKKGKKVEDASKNKKCAGSPYSDLAGKRKYANAGENNSPVRDEPEGFTASRQLKVDENESLSIVHSAVTLCETVIGLQNGHYPVRTEPQKPSPTDTTRLRRLSGTKLKSLERQMEREHSPKDERTLSQLGI